jgi:altronate hydrolase
MARTLVLHDADDVAILTERAQAGDCPLGIGPQLQAPVPAGHKIARRAIAGGDIVTKFGQMIGFASEDIPAGAHVHSHNLAFGAHGSGGQIGDHLHAAKAAMPGMPLRSFGE